MYTRVSSFIPNSIRQEFQKQLIYNGIEMNVNKFVGFLFLYGFFLAIGISANAFVFFQFNPAIAFLLSFSGFVGIAYILMKLNSESKGKFVESILPDALRLVASNMRSGLTTERALFVAGRSEFGPLQFELKNASKRIASGERTENALRMISIGISSKILDKTLWLISQGIRSGGQIADLLFQLSDDLKEQIALEDEIKSNISIYVLLILFSAVMGAPMLFGVSSFIVQVLSNQIASVPAIDTSNMQGGSLGPISGFASKDAATLDPEFIVMFSIVMLVFTTLFSSLTIGVINSGKEINGLKYVIPLTIVALIVFFTARVLLTSFFGNLI
ncbi:MAG: type II secretion system F family protein [archaeon]|nr:type II secretion system F family protein [archaeon]